MSRRTVYANRGRTPRNCYSCDGAHGCKCDVVTMRAAKRGAKQTWAREDADVAIEAAEVHAFGDFDIHEAWRDEAA